MSDRTGPENPNGTPESAHPEQGRTGPVETHPTPIETTALDPAEAEYTEMDPSAVAEPDD